jgi:hypothetical protein
LKKNIALFRAAFLASAQAVMRHLKRYIFSFKGPGQAPDEDLQLLRDRATVVDTSRRAVLVEPASRKILNELTTRLANWTVSEEHFVPVPSTQFRVR